MTRLGCPSTTSFAQVEKPGPLPDKMASGRAQSSAEEYDQYVQHLALTADCATMRHAGYDFCCHSGEESHDF